MISNCTINTQLVENHYSLLLSVNVKDSKTGL